VDEWKLRVDGLDNHWLDCLVGCAVGASMEGVALPGLALPEKKPRKKTSLAQIQRERRAARR